MRPCRLPSPPSPPRSRCVGVRPGRMGPREAAPSAPRLARYFAADYLSRLRAPSQLPLCFLNTSTRQQTYEESLLIRFPGFPLGKRGNASPSSTYLGATANRKAINNDGRGGTFVAAVAQTATGAKINIGRASPHSPDPCSCGSGETPTSTLLNVQDVGMNVMP